jgi:nucleoside-diphosphate-sugar epimerase
MVESGQVIGKDDLVLVTGSAGFIGNAVIASLLERGFRNIRCLVRPSTPPRKIAALSALASSDRLQLFRGNLHSRGDCLAATERVKLVYHLAAGRGDRSYPDAYLNSVVVTRNLLDACVQHGQIDRFVNVSSFVVYTNRNKARFRLLDETCPTEPNGLARGEAYCFGKVKQDEMVLEYGRKHNLSFVLVRPGAVYGPGNLRITGRVGIDTFGIFLHLGGSSFIPLSYVDNCADAIVQVGLAPGVDGEVFNVVDDDLPTSRDFLRLYKRNVRRFSSWYVPKHASYALCWLWERYSRWSEGQLPPNFNLSRWHALWKKTAYCNQKLKSRAGWQQKIPTADALQRYFAACRAEANRG